MQEVEDAFYHQGALVIVTDTANSPESVIQRYQLAEKLIKIDRHPNDDPYGDLVWVNTKSKRLSEMIAEFALMFPELFKMNVEAARLLYAGIVGDTGRFCIPPRRPVH